MSAGSRLYQVLLGVLSKNLSGLSDLRADLRDLQTHINKVTHTWRDTIADVNVSCCSISIFCTSCPLVPHCDWLLRANSGLCVSVVDEGGGSARRRQRPGSEPQSGPGLSSPRWLWCPGGGPPDADAASLLLSRPDPQPESRRHLQAWGCGCTLSPDPPGTTPRCVHRHTGNISITWAELKSINTSEDCKGPQAGTSDSVPHGRYFIDRPSAIDKQIMSFFLVSCCTSAEIQNNLWQQNRRDKKYNFYLFFYIQQTEPAAATRDVQAVINGWKRGHRLLQDKCCSS